MPPAPGFSSARLRQPYASFANNLATPAIEHERRPSLRPTTPALPGRVDASTIVVIERPAW